MIKLIITTYTSKRDVYGNCYHSAVFTSTATGDSFQVRETGGDSNAAHFARKAGLDWTEISSSQSVLPIREYNRLVKAWPYKSFEDTVAAIQHLVGGAKS